MHGEGQPEVWPRSSGRRGHKRQDAERDDPSRNIESQESDKLVVDGFGQRVSRRVEHRRGKHRERHCDREMSGTPARRGGRFGEEGHEGS